MAFNFGLSPFQPEDAPFADIVVNIGPNGPFSGSNSESGEDSVGESEYEEEEEPEPFVRPGGGRHRYGGGQGDPHHDEDRHTVLLVEEGLRAEAKDNNNNSNSVNNKNDNASVGGTEGTQPFVRPGGGRGGGGGTKPLKLPAVRVNQLLPSATTLGGRMKSKLGSITRSGRRKKFGSLSVDQAGAATMIGGREQAQPVGQQVVEPPLPPLPLPPAPAPPPPAPPPPSAFVRPGGGRGGCRVPAAAISSGYAASVASDRLRRTISSASDPIRRTMSVGSGSTSHHSSMMELEVFRTHSASGEHHEMRKVRFGGVAHGEGRAMTGGEVEVKPKKKKIRAKNVTTRREKRQGWSGEWNQGDMQIVIDKLRTLK